MSPRRSPKTLSAEQIQPRILLIRGQKIMLSTDLALLYEVEPKVLVQAVKRNQKRFPTDFMFQLSRSEFQNLKSQFVTSSWGGIRRSTPYAFTEQGIAMLSGVLNGARAIQANIAIMRAFVRLRRIVAAHRELVEKLNEMERRLENHDTEIRSLFEAIWQLMEPPVPRRRRIGFRAD